MLTLFEDVRYALRGLRKSPLFTTVALASLAVGIGANTAVFSLMDQALLRSLPVQHPEQLVLFSAPGPRSGTINSNYNDHVAFSYPMYREFRDGNTVFSGVMARFPISFSVSWNNQTERVSGDLVSGNYFEVLGVHAAIGRTFTEDDDRKPGAEPVVVLSYGYWKRRFAADPGVLNQTVILNSHPMTIVGVAQAGFNSVGVGEAQDVFVPMMMQGIMMPLRGNDLENKRSMWLNVFARLKPGVSRQQAEAAMNVFWKPILESEAKDIPNLSQSVRARFLNRHLSLEAGGQGVSGAPPEFSAVFAVLMGMVGLLLLIACANVANLLIARASARQREVSIRLAMGASRGQLIRQLLTESLVLAVGGGLLGLLVADWTGGGLLRLLPDDPSVHGLTSHPDTRIFLFALGLSLITGLLFGLAPAIQGTRAELAATLKDQASGVVGGFGHIRFRKGLVVTQVALSLVLLIAAGLFTRSLYNVKNIDVGMRTDHLIQFTIQPSLNGYSQARMLALFERLHDDISKFPGVHAVSMAEEPVLAGDMIAGTIKVEGYQSKEDEDMTVYENYVGPGYLATMGIPLLAGRDFTKADGPGAPHVAVINQKTAEHFFGKENPLGRHVAFGRGNDRMEIVGLVKNGKASDPKEKTQQFLFGSYSQRPMNQLTFYARTAQDPLAMAQALRAEVRRQDANMPIFNVKTLEMQIDESLFVDRLVAMLSAAFGMLATLLAAIGLYGVMAFMVVRRTREIGIRMALGADRRSVLRLVMREVLMLAGAGIVIALLASLAVGRVVQSQLLGVSAHDPLVMACATGGLALVALFAGYLPALRATRVDPLSALRYE
ncbi:MAG TPA: ABC transporter permease [Bryobacteraceae bacterium]|jgi:predicted permease|nr:ABC transporter permease [Bryobacteraceae bacterium]